MALFVGGSEPAGRGGNQTALLTAGSVWGVCEIWARGAPSRDQFKAAEHPQARFQPRTLPVWREMIYDTQLPSLLP